jgi:hypothetical protein
MTPAFLIIKLAVFGSFLGTVLGFILHLVVF